MYSLLLAYTLILVGALTLAAELVLFSHGILAVIGFSGVLVGTMLVFGQDPVLGLATLILLLVVAPVVGRVMLNYWPNTPIGRRLVLPVPRENDTTVSQEMEYLRGRYGKTLSALRPSGITEFDGRRIDTLSEGVLIEAGQWVRCIDVREGKVIVRLMAGPPGLTDLENMQMNDSIKGPG